MRAQAAPIKSKFGNDLRRPIPLTSASKRPSTPITKETKGRVAISLFPNSQLGSDTDMMTQLRSGALELATMPGTVLSTLIPTASLTGVGFAFTSYDKVWAAMDGEVGNFIRRNIEKVGLGSVQRGLGQWLPADHQRHASDQDARRISPTSRFACRSCRCGFRCSRPSARLRSVFRSTKPIPRCKPKSSTVRKIRLP